MIKNLKFIFTIISLFSSSAIACEYQDVTENTMAAVREQLINNSQNPGYRISFVDFKKKNKKHGGGSVDDAVAGFVESVCKQFEDIEKEKKIKISIKKTDFKGLYLECSPNLSCEKLDEKIKEKIENLDKPKIVKTQVDEKTKLKKIIVEGQIELRAARGENYTDGYVRARVSEAYPEFDNKTNVVKFLNNELEEGLKLAFGIDKNKIKTLSKKQKLNIQKAMNQWRNGEPVSKKFLTLVKAVDAMETPFPGSDNFEKALKKATTITAEDRRLSKGKYILKKAKSGDDIMYVIIKDGEIKKIVGADAKGLGVLNSSERLDSFLNSIGRMESIQDLVEINEVGIDNANKKMANSMELLEKNLLSELGKGGSRSLNERISKANNEYKRAQRLSRDGLMEMRSAYIEGCLESAGCIQDEITAIHNKLKILEEHGHNGYLGDSCIGVEYRLRRLGIVKMKK